jgi:hypothetical protein
LAAQPTHRTGSRLVAPVVLSPERAFFQHALGAEQRNPHSCAVCLLASVLQTLVCPAPRAGCPTLIRGWAVTSIHDWSEEMSQKQQNDQNQKQAHGGDKGDMTVREAGQMGGHKGGQRERELVEKGHQAEERGGRKH